MDASGARRRNIRNSGRASLARQFARTFGRGFSNCIAIEHFALQKDIYNFERLLTLDSRLVIKDGAAVVPDRPGIGAEFDEVALRAYEISK
jgi:L-alanine-DL-glutamate epimerase-like enolase superfamily enzyme